MVQYSIVQYGVAQVYSTMACARQHGRGERHEAPGRVGELHSIIYVYIDICIYTYTYADYSVVYMCSTYIYIYMYSVYINK